MEDDDFDAFDDTFDETFLAAVDQLVAQHKGKAQQHTQPDSSNTRAGAATGAAGGHRPPPQQYFANRPAAPQQQAASFMSGQVSQPYYHHQQPQLQLPVPHLASSGGTLPAAPTAPRPASAGPYASQPVRGQGLANGTPAGFPKGRVSQVAAELCMLPATATAADSVAAELQQQLIQLQQDRDKLQQELGSELGRNKLLRDNLEQAERDRNSLRQRLQQLEARAPTAVVAAGTQPSFTMAEMQKQLDTIKHQLMFREQEIEDLKRQQSSKLERLREAEAAMQSLQAQIQATQQQGRQQQQQQSQQQRGQLDRGQPQGASPSVGDPQHSSLRRRPPPQQQQQQEQQPPRASGHKRRQSLSVAGDTMSAAVPHASPSTSAHTATAVGRGPTAALLGTAAVASSFNPSTAAAEGLISRLWVACGESLRTLLGSAASMPGSEAAAKAAAPALPSQRTGASPCEIPGRGPSALLHRIQFKSSAASAAPDPAAASFCQTFSLQLQQVAAGLLPAAALVDSIGAMAVTMVADGCMPCSGDSLGNVAGAAPGVSGQCKGGSSIGGIGLHLPLQRAQLLADGLHVLQHLIEQDTSCRAAAVLSSCAAASGGSCSGTSDLAVPARPGVPSGSADVGPAGLIARLQLSSRVSLKDRESQQQQPPQQQKQRGSMNAVSLQQCENAVRQHSALFASKGQGLTSVLVAAAIAAVQQHQQVLSAALGALCALAAAIPVGGGREAMKPILETGAMEQFLQPPHLRVQALQLLHHLLKEPVLVHAFEQSLAQAGSSGQGGETPGSGGSGGSGNATRPQGLSGDESSLLLSKHRSGSKGASAQAGPANNGAEPMHVDGGSSTVWAGAPTVLRRVLQSLSLPPASPQPAEFRPDAHAHTCTPQHAQLGAAPREAPAPSTAAAAAGTAAADSAMAASGSPPCAMARQALKLVAMLREQQMHGVLTYLIGGEDSNGGNVEGLCQRLIQLVEVATAQQAANASLFPMQFPWAPAELSPVGQGVASSLGVAAAQLAWQQRLRVAQEALTLLRGLLTDPALGALAMDELCSTPSTCRLCLTTLGRLTRLEPEQQAGPSFSGLPLPLWAQVIGSSSSNPQQAGGTSVINPRGGRGSLVCCSVDDVVYMTRMRARILHKLAHTQ